MKKMMMLVAAGMLLASVSSAAVLTYTSQSAWQSAVGNWYTFQFAGNFNSTPAGYTVSITQSGNNGYSGISGTAPNQLYQDVLATGGAQVLAQYGFVPSTTTVTWSGPSMFAAGGLWNTSPVNEGGGINIVLNLAGGGTQTVTTIGPINGFFGWISDVPFNSFTLSTNANLQDPFSRPYGIEHYTVDNLQIAAIPEPTTLSMLGVALLGLGAFRRFQRS